jgi:hypothetical protein
MNQQQTSATKFHLVYVTTRGYTRADTFVAESLLEACRRHIAAWKAKRLPTALVLRAPDGKRYSFFDSSAIAGSAA